MKRSQPNEGTMHEEQPKKAERVLTVADFTADHMAEVQGVMASLSKKHGHGAMIAGAQLLNLSQMAKALQDALTNDPTMDDEGRGKINTFAMDVISGVMSILAPAVGACCKEHVGDCTKAIKAAISVCAADAGGEKALATTEVEAKADLDRILAGAKACGGGQKQP